MKRNANVARTAFDLTHENRIRVPEFRIVSLNLISGAKSSKSYLPDDAPPTPSAGDDGFHFVPEKETIQITYELDDRFAMIQTLKLELFRKYDKTAMWTLDLTKLGPNTLIHGKHTLKFDGRVSKDATATQDGTESDKGIAQDLTALAADTTIHADFPDGYMTIQHSPYKLRLTATDGGKPTAITSTAWTYFHILVKQLVIELGPNEAIPTQGLSEPRKAADLAVVQAIHTAGGVPASGGTARNVFLVSNIFKTNGAEMNDNTAYVQYQTAWDDGPRIPLICKVRLLASDDTEVKLEDGPGAKALGKVKFLWTWDDPDWQGTSQEGHQSQAAPKAFIKAAINYYRDGTDSRNAAKNHTYPKSSNCHVDRDGKRGPDATTVFPGGGGYVTQKDALDETIFPFKVDVCDTRKWASFSYGWTKGLMKGQTGVLFRPSRMAGENYTISVYLAYETKMDGTKEAIVVDVKDEPLKTPDAIKAVTGPLQTWREMHISRYIRKKNSIADFIAAHLGDVQALYQEPYVQVVNKMAGGDKFELPTAGYDVLAKSKLTTSSDALITNNLCVNPAHDHSTVAATFKTRTYAEFVTQTDTTFNTVTNLGGGAAWRTSKGINSQIDYCNKLNAILNPPAKAVVNSLNTLTTPSAANDGITIIQFEYLGSEQGNVAAANGGTLPNGMAMLNGSAMDVPGATRNRCCFAFWNARVDTFVHEIGHHLFLPHSQSAGGEQPLRHDSADAGCIMSYNRPRPAFCGLCQLRLRGWNAGSNDGSAILKNVAAQNKKP